jgi:peptide subunit release factor 1 (eRF1)
VLEDAFASDGPVVTAHLITDGSQPQAARRTALRWKTLRARLTAEGAPESALTAIDPLVEVAHTGGAALFAVADADGLRYAAHLPEPPATDDARVGPLPHLVPLLAATQQHLPHLVVVTDRLGAELIVVLPGQDDEHAEVDGEELHITRSAPGGWSQRRFQQRAENRWEANAREVSDAVTALFDRTAPRLVVISGDVRAVQFLREHLPGRVTDVVTEVQGDYSSLDEALHRSRDVVAAAVADDTAALLAEHDRGSGEGLAVGGAEDTLTALRAGQAHTVLLDPTRAADRSGWFGPDGSQVGSTAIALHATGVLDPQPAALADVVIRAAASTAAAVRIMPAGTPATAQDGVAALLRYR